MMRRGIEQVGLMVLLICLSLQQVPADPNQAVSYMGRLLDGTNFVSGDVALTYKLYIAETGGFSAYYETDTVYAVDGRYETRIGDNPYPGYDLMFATWAIRTNAWLELTVNGQVMTPRNQLASTPFALNTRGLSVDQNGCVGAFTRTPAERLHLYDTNAAGVSRAFMRIESSHPASWPDTRMRIQTPANRWELRMDDVSHADIPEGALALHSDTPDAYVMTWTENGRVGIGTTTPQQALDVDGDIMISSNYTYTTIRTNTIFFQPCDFKYTLDDDGFNFNDTNTSFIVMNSGALHILDASAGSWSGICAVHLPDGATITNMYTYYIDQSVSYDLELRSMLYDTGRNNPAGGYAMTPENTFTSSGSYALSPQSFSPTNIESATVSTAGETVYIAVNYNPDAAAPPADLGFYGVRLDYTVDVIHR